MARTREIQIGTAGWTLPRGLAQHFPGSESHLERYARAFGVVEVNSTFYRLPRATTLQRWRETTPGAFQFSVKVPQSITHEAGLCGVAALLREFVELVGHLGPKLGPLLVQLPPKLEFEARTARAFMRRLRGQHAGDVVWEPRHPSWFRERATELLVEHRMARVAADPARCAGAECPAGFERVVYYRLHGSPRMYYSEYSSEFIAALSQRLWRAAGRGTRVFCIFDNTALGAALPNALELAARIRSYSSI